MKINGKYILYSLFLSYLITPIAVAHSVLYRNEDTDRQEGLMLYAPVDLSPDGVSNFLTHVFNRREYVHVLPNNLNHIAQFLEHGKSNQQNRAYTQSALKLFGNKLKGASYINAYAFESFLAQMPELLHHHFEQRRLDTFDVNKEIINTILYETFLSKYENFKKNPKEFFDSLSHDILDNLHQDTPNVSDEDIPMHELRATIIRFLEMNTAKLIWSPQEYGKIWQNVKEISKHFETLVEHNIIIDANDLDDLSWSLLHRFCYFLQLSNKDLPSEFYEEIKSDMASGQLLFLELEEQEELIESKRDYLTQAIFEGQARKQAVEMGVIVG